MSLQRLLQQQSGNGNLEYPADPAYSAYATLTGPLTMEDSRRIQMLADTVATLPRGRKQVGSHFCLEWMFMLVWWRPKVVLAPARLHEFPDSQPHFPSLRVSWFIFQREFFPLLRSTSLLSQSTQDLGVIDCMCGGRRWHAQKRQCSTLEMGKQS